MQPETTYPAIVGRIIEHRRKAKGLGQDHIAQGLGLTQSAWSRIERGQSGISIEQLGKVSDLLATTPNQILAEADRAKDGLERQGVKVRRNVGVQEEVVAFIALAALGAMIFAILAKK